MKAMKPDPRTPFDSVPEAFDRWRPRYCDELFDRVASRAALGPGKRSLEIGPGTGQATEFALRTGADCTAVELGANLAAEDYVAFIGTHSDHIGIRPDCREPFFGGIRAAISAPTSSTSGRRSRNGAPHTAAAGVAGSVRRMDRPETDDALPLPRMSIVSPCGVDSVDQPPRPRDSLFHGR